MPKAAPRPPLPKARIAPPVSVSVPKPSAPPPVIAKPAPAAPKLSIPEIPKRVALSPLEDAVEDQIAETKQRKTPEEREALRAEKRAKREQGSQRAAPEEGAGGEPAKRTTPEEREALRAKRAERLAKREQRLKAQPEIPELIAAGENEEAERPKTPEERAAFRAERAEKRAKREERLQRKAQREREDQNA
jgi:hypothetical protein